MSSKGGSGVPKFGSFKKKPEPVPVLEKDHENEKHKRREGRDTTAEKDRSHNPQKHQSDKALVQLPERQDFREKRGSREKGISHQKVEFVQRSVPQQQSPAELFVIDKRGDPQIRRYGSNDRYKVPVYRRFGAGRLLGSNSFFSIDRSGNRDEFFLRQYGQGRSELSRDRKSVLAKARRNGSDLVRVRLDKAQTFTGAEDFLPLKQSRKRKRTHSGSDESADEKETSYRSIHGMSKKHEHSDSDESYGSESSSSEVELVDAADPIKRKHIELTARVKDHPQDIDAWVQLVDHQDVLRDLNCHNGQSATLAEIKSYADIKLSMLEKALKHSKTPEQTADLRLRIMQEGLEIWDPKTASQRWEELLADHGTNFDIWKAYMTFRQSNLSTLRYDNIKQLYANKLRAIEKESKEEPSGPKRQMLYEQLVVVFSRVTHFTAESGYTELATAAWQAILELHFHRPTSLADASSELALSSLQSFWESEAPRIGEEHAKGWAAFESQGGIEEPPEPKIYNDGQIPQTKDPYKAWAAVEKHRAQDARVPARTMDDGTEDDPFRVIMYPDIGELLFYIPTTSLELVQEPLLDAFLVFCRLPPVFGTSSAIQTMLRDRALSDGINMCSITENNLEKQDADDTEIRPPVFNHQVQNLVQSQEVMFPIQRWFTYIKSVHGAMTSEQYILVSSTLRQLASSFRSADLATYCLSFDGINNTGSSKKLAKALLKQDPSCTDLYIGFARSEFFKGSKDAGKNVISAALGLTGLTTYNRLRLCIAWTWMELEDNQSEQALIRLCQASEETRAENSSSPALVLKMRQFLIGNRDHLLSSRELKNAVTYAEALSLLEYMTRTSGKESQSKTQGDIWSAIESVNSCSEAIRSRGLAESSAHENLLQFSAQLLYYHASRGPYRPVFFREQIERYIQLFPRNTIFLSLYAWREQRLSIEDRVRSMLDKTVLTKANDCPSSRVFAIRHEMSTGNAHSTRAAFERAVESDTCKYHIGIWVSYIRYCYQKRELRSKAKDVFYRAVQRCPWAKEIFMEAFITLVREMDSSELKSVYNTLCDKGLRVHVELDEFVESWKNAQKQRSR